MMYLFYTLHLTTHTYAKLEIHTLPAKLSPCCVWSHFKLGLLGNLHLLRNLVVSWYVTARGSTLPLCSKLFISASSDVSFHCQTTTPGPSTCWGGGRIGINLLVMRGLLAFWGVVGHLHDYNRPLKPVITCARRTVIQTSGAYVAKF